MDRRIVYIGAIPQDLDSLLVQRYAMIAQGYLAQGVLGAGPYVDGLACTPTSPASLSVNFASGAIFQTSPVDSSNFGSVAADSIHSIVKLGVLIDGVSKTLTPPSTPGQAINYLVQVQLLEQDVDVATLPYFNPASLTNPSAAPWSGPNNSGTAQPQTRQQTVQISLKAGVAATAGTQTTPAPDVGYVGLYAITVAQGATQITSGNIATLASAPFINPKLPQVPGWTQSGSWRYGVDTGTKNNLVVTLNPAPATYGAGGLSIDVKAAFTNDGAVTLNVNGLGAKPVMKPSGVACSGGEIVAGSIVTLTYDGAQFYLRTAQATNTNTSTGGLTSVATTDPIQGDGSSGNPVKIRDADTSHKGAIQAATGSNYLGNSSGVALTPDAVWDAASFKTVNYGSSWAPDFTAGFNFDMTLSGDLTLNNPQTGTLKSGQTGAIRFIQDSLGGRALNFPVGKVYFFPGGVPTLSTAPGAMDVLVYKAITPTFVICQLLEGARLMLLGIYDDLLMAGGAAVSPAGFKLALSGYPLTAGGNPPIVLTKDLVNFTSATLPWNGCASGLAVGNEIVLAAGAALTPSFPSGTGALALSRDGGATFTQVAHPNSGVTTYPPPGASVAFGRGLFLLVPQAVGVGYELWTSSDGLTWTQRARPWSGYAIPFFVNGLFWLVGYDNQAGAPACASSADGISFTRRPDIWPVGGNSISGVAYINGQWVLSRGGYNGNCEIAVSPDLANWTRYPLPWSGGSAYVTSVVYFKGRYYAAGYTMPNSGGNAPGAGQPPSGSYLASSADLKSWSLMSTGLPAGFNFLANLGDKLFVSVQPAIGLASWGNGSVSYTPQGANFQAYSTSDMQSFARVATPNVFWEAGATRLS